MYFKVRTRYIGMYNQFAPDMDAHNQTVRRVGICAMYFPGMHVCMHIRRDVCIRYICIYNQYASHKDVGTISMCVFGCGHRLFLVRFVLESAHNE